MRIWSIHPKYLDSKGLVALWRETLLAQAVIDGKTRGYKNHPQLFRFAFCSDPLGAIGQYLKHTADEAEKRGYKFNVDKIIKVNSELRLLVNNDQLRYEFCHLQNKLLERDIVKYKENCHESFVQSVPMFNIVPGGIESWEIIKRDINLETTQQADAPEHPSNAR